MQCLAFKKPLSHSECQSPPCGVGMPKAVYQCQGHLQVEECLTSTQSKVPKQNISSSTHALAVENKLMTCNDKKHIYETIYLRSSIQHNAKKSTTSDQASISKEKVLQPFWNKSYQTLYKQLSWLPETDCAALGLNSWNGCVSNMEPTSWFSTTKIQPLNKSLEKTSCPLFKCTAVDGMEKEGTKTITKCLKLRLRPTPQQKHTLEQWAHASRYTYNVTTSALNNPNLPKKSKNKLKLRDRYVTATSRNKVKNNFFSNKSWLLETPKAVRKGAVDDAYTAYKACHTNLRNGNIKHFDIGYRSRKMQDMHGWSLYIESNNIARVDNNLKIFSESLGDMRYYNTHQLKKLISGKTKQLKKCVKIQPIADCRLQKDAYGDYYLNVPISVEKSTPKSKGIASLDPGVRKFITSYSPDREECYMYGVRFMETLWPLLFRYDRLQTEGKRSEMNRVLKRIRNLKQEMKFQVANALTNRYDTLLVPKLDTTQLISSRGLKTKTARRAMQNTGHCGFYDHLQHKCQERGVRFVPVTEEYTSQTCHRCGTLTKTSAETRKCSRCGYIGDRDIIASLNILLKAVSAEH